MIVYNICGFIFFMKFVYFLRTTNEQVWNYEFFFTIFDNCHNELDCNSQCNLVSLFTIYVLQLNEKERLFPLNPFFFTT